MISVRWSGKTGCDSSDRRERKRANKRGRASIPSASQTFVPEQDRTREREKEARRSGRCRQNDGRSAMLAAVMPHERTPIFCDFFIDARLVAVQQQPTEPVRLTGLMLLRRTTLTAGRDGQHAFTYLLPVRAISTLCTQDISEKDDDGLRWDDSQPNHPQHTPPRGSSRAVRMDMPIHRVYVACQRPGRGHGRMDE